jgi:hypothetical protein
VNLSAHGIRHAFLVVVGIQFAFAVALAVAGSARRTAAAVGEPAPARPPSHRSRVEWSAGGGGRRG